mmetsp:Transcript_14221/g.44767  ORF Transcript_14221/g.44767 Transcript_14221/m.44767 type:complete len:230 (+) Transcript_14221:52-741(+)
MIFQGCYNVWRVRNVGCSVPVVVGGGRVCAGLQQRLHSLELIAQRCIVQRGRSVCVYGVQRHVLRQQEAQCAKASAVGSHHERRYAVRVGKVSQRRGARETLQGSSVVLRRSRECSSNSVRVTYGGGGPGRVGSKGRRKLRGDDAKARRTVVLVVDVTRITLPLLPATNELGEFNVPTSGKGTTTIQLDPYANERPILGSPNGVKQRGGRGGGGCWRPRTCRNLVQGVQ